MSLSRICEIYGISRQNYYKLKKRAKIIKINQQKIISMIQEIRRIHPRMGIKKIYHLIKEKIRKEGIKIGRDGIYKIAREHGYLVKRKRRASKTTRRGLRKFSNHLKGLVIKRINQVWVSDITYVRVGLRDFGYLW